jgi:hypothetical protein
VNLLGLIIRACGAAVTAECEPPFIALAVLVSGLDYWGSTARATASLEDIDTSKDEVGREVIRALSLALKLDPKRLKAEAEAARARLAKEHLYRLIDRAEVEADWSRIEMDQVDASLIAQGLVHPCPLIALCATKAILSGIGGTAAIELIPSAFESNEEHTIWYAAALAEARLGTRAVDICLSRLERPISADHSCLFRVMARHCMDERRETVVKSFMSWLVVDDPELASSVAEQLKQFDPPLGVEAVQGLRDALDHWTRRGTRCEKHGALIHDRSCPECHVVPPSPRAALVKELNRLGGMPFEELTRLCSDQRHDVSDAAIAGVLGRASADDETFEKVLELIEARQLSPRILDKLLKLPIRSGSAVAKKAVALLHSSDVSLRLATIGQLTGEWIERDRAITYLRNSLKDPEPAVRTLATRILRLLV